jgi:hypothetical protein
VIDLSTLDPEDLGRRVIRLNRLDVERRGRLIGWGEGRCSVRYYDDEPTPERGAFGYVEQQERPEDLWWGD